MSEGLHDNSNSQRITFFLPANNAQEFKALRALIGIVRKGNLENATIKSFLHSSVRPTLFNGWWHNGDKWFRDGMVEFIIDYEVTNSSTSAIDGAKEIKNIIRQQYANYGVPQEDILMTVHSIIRV